MYAPAVPGHLLTQKTFVPNLMANQVVKHQHLAPWTADKELVRGTLRVRPVGSKPLRRQWVIAYLPGRRLNLLEETFCRLCRNFAAGLRLDRHDVPRAPI